MCTTASFELRLPGGKCEDCGVTILPDSEVRDFLHQFSHTYSLIIRLQVYPDKAARREIDSLEVYCPNRPTGCDWTGLLSSLEAHTSQCPHKGVPCPNEGCGQVTPAAKMEHHLTECPFRLVECGYCHSTLPHCQLSVSAIDSVGTLICPCGVVVI